MELEHRDHRDSYIYDPTIKGFDSSFWATLAGTPTNASPIVLNVATIASFGLHEFVQEADFSLNVVTAPTAGHSRRWGFFSPAAGLGAGSAYFDITGTTFSVNISDNAGNTQTLAVAWLSAWTNHQITYKICWETNRVQFWVNGAIVATFQPNYQAVTSEIPYGALPLYIKNAVADAFAVYFVNILRPAGIV